jgi:hypothetical protein
MLLTLFLEKLSYIFYVKSDITFIYFSLFRSIAVLNPALASGNCLCVPTRNVRDLLTFSVSLCNKHCPAPCAYVTNMVVTDIFAIGAPVAREMEIHDPYKTLIYPLKDRSYNCTRMYHLL